MKTLIVLAVVLSQSLYPVFAQSRINSPYSMHGPGEVASNTNFSNMGMGGISQAFRSNKSINFINPASYTAIDSTSFIFETNIFSHFYGQQIIATDQQQMTQFAGMGNFNFGFPVLRWWRVAGGIRPYSFMGYNISENFDDPANGPMNYLYEGSGGINQVYLGHGFKLLPGLSLGINMNYLFGRIKRDVILSAEEISGFYTTQFSNVNQVGGLKFDFGIQYETLLAGKKVQLGASYAHDTDIGMRQDEVVTRHLGSIIRNDTINYIKGESGTMRIPANMGAGIFVTLNDLVSVGADFETQAWNTFKLEGETHNLNDAWQIRTGALFSPSVETYSGFFSRLNYQVGARYGQSFLFVNEEVFNEFGLSFGVRVPVRRSFSGIALGFEYAQRASQNENMIKEEFFRLNLNVNIYERWFIRGRFH